jgi:membrane fusion protein, multidrug efflux system
MPNRLLDCLRGLACGGLSDGQLLALFVQHRDEDAFTALLNRHSPMVMGVCRRILRDQHDAEDAHQATFLIFTRKAGSVRAQDSIGGWLYRVAYRTALEARARIIRRRGKEQQVNELPDPAVEPDEERPELLASLDKEIDRLPDKYRVPVVLCELEGRSRKDAAHLLGVPEGTLSWRLAQAKKMLAQRLSRRGLAVSGAALAAAMAPGTTSAFLRVSTVKAALSVGAVQAEVLALTEGVMKAMLLTKLKITLCVTVLALMAFAGASGVAYRAVAQEKKQVESGSSAVGPSAADDLEALRLENKALRLEIEALRKSLQATRERVKTLENKEQPRRENQKIVVTSPQAKDVLVTQRYVCQIQSQRHINIRALANGYLEKIFVKEGQAVKQGDMMFKIEPTLYQAKYDAELAEVKLAQIQLDEIKKLFEKKAVSSQEMTLYQTKLDKAKAKAKLAEAELNFTIVKAPFDGIVDRLHEQVGSLINERDILTTLSDNRVMWVYFNVPEARYLEYMAAKDQDKEVPRIELVLANGSKFAKTAQGITIEAKFNNETGNIPFRADFENPNGLLRHGQTGNVLIHRTLNNALVIPQRAVFEILDRRYVWVVDKDGVVHQRKVVVQDALEDSFVIKSGLDVNHRIVLEGVQQITDGEKVEYEFRKPEQRLPR